MFVSIVLSEDPSFVTFFNYDWCCCETDTKIALLADNEKKYQLFEFTEINTKFRKV